MYVELVASHWSRSRAGGAAGVVSPLGALCASHGGRGAEPGGRPTTRDKSLVSLFSSSRFIGPDWGAAGWLFQRHPVGSRRSNEPSEMKEEIAHSSHLPLTLLGVASVSLARWADVIDPASKCQLRRARFRKARFSGRFDPIWTSKAVGRCSVAVFRLEGDGAQAGNLEGVGFRQASAWGCVGAWWAHGRK